MLPPSSGSVAQREPTSRQTRLYLYFKLCIQFPSQTVSPSPTKIQDYAYRERNALNLLKERPWSPSHLLSSLTESNSKTRCNSIAEEDEEKVVNEKTTLCKLASSVIEDEDEEDDKSKIITEETGDVVVNDNEDAAQNALLKEQRQLQHQQRKQFLRLQQQQRRGQVSSSGQKKSTQMRNPFFVELHSSFASAGHFFLVLSHALNGDLLQCLKVSWVLQFLINELVELCCLKVSLMVQFLKFLFVSLFIHTHS